MTGIDAWREEASDLEEVWLENFLAEYFDDPWHVSHRKIESSGWTVALIPSHLGTAMMGRLREAYPGEFPEVWVIEDHQVVEHDEHECYRVGERRKHFMSAAGSGDFVGSVIVPRTRDFLLVHNVSSAAVHRWTVCAERPLLEATLGTSLQTRWIQYRLYAEWGEELESATEEMNMLADWYAPYNRLEDEPDLEVAREVVSRRLEPTLLPGDFRERASEWVQGDVLREDLLAERGWMAGPMAGLVGSFGRHLWDWAPAADRIAAAARACGVDQAHAVPVTEGGPHGYLVQMTRGGLMAFERRAAEEDLVLLPAEEEFAIYGSSLRYFLCAGDEQFVRQCLVHVDIERALLDFERRLEQREGDWNLPRRVENGGVSDIHREVLDWCETQWLKYLDRVGEG